MPINLLKGKNKSEISKNIFKESFKLTLDTNKNLLKIAGLVIIFLIVAGVALDPTFLLLAGIVFIGFIISLILASLASRHFYVSKRHEREKRIERRNQARQRL